MTDAQLVELILKYVYCAHLSVNRKTNRVAGASIETKEKSHNSSPSAEKGGHPPDERSYCSSGQRRKRRNSRLGFGCRTWEMQTSCTP